MQNLQNRAENHGQWALRLRTPGDSIHEPGEEIRREDDFQRENQERPAPPAPRAGNPEDIGPPEHREVL